MKMAQVENEQELRQVSPRPRVLCPFLSVASSLKQKVKTRPNPTPSFPNPLLPQPLPSVLIVAPRAGTRRIPALVERAAMDRRDTGYSG